MITDPHLHLLNRLIQAVMFVGLFILLQGTKYPPTRMELNGNSVNLNERAKELAL